MALSSAERQRRFLQKFKDEIEALKAENAELRAEIDHLRFLSEHVEEERIPMEPVVDEEWR